MSRLELGIAWRYLRSRRGSKLLSLISVIAIGGVVVGVSALIVIMGVMTGLQNDLREKILIGSPDIRVLTIGSDMVMKDWEPVLKKVRAEPGVVAAAPFVLTKALVERGAQVQRRRVRRWASCPQGGAAPRDDDPLASRRRATSASDARRQAARAPCSASGWRTGCSVYPGRRLDHADHGRQRGEPGDGDAVPRRDAARGDRRVQHRDVRVRQRVPVRLARRSRRSWRGSATT